MTLLLLVNMSPIGHIGFICSTQYDNNKKYKSGIFDIK